MPVTMLPGKWLFWGLSVAHISLEYTQQKVLFSSSSVGRI